jgi:5-hydroxyisourate hydrolase
MSAISTHVLDTTLGKPAPGVSVQLDRWEETEWRPVATSATDGDGRCRDLAANAEFGVYRLTFGSGTYLSRSGRASIYPEIAVTFTCDGEAHYHLPLLLSDHSYTTYRGS